MIDLKVPKLTANALITSKDENYESFYYCVTRFEDLKRAKAVMQGVQEHMQPAKSVENFKMQHEGRQWIVVSGVNVFINPKATKVTSLLGEHEGLEIILSLIYKNA